jgi:general secretion pathway protein I
VKRPASNFTAGPGASGFTLLEVLVALVIIGLGMMAVFDQLNQMISTATRLQDKTFASWIAVDRITELHVNGQYPRVGDQSDEIEMAGADWTYTIKVSQIPNMDMRRVDVTVSYLDTPNDILAEVSGFVTPPQEATAGVSAGGSQTPSGGVGASAGGSNQSPVGGVGASAGTGFGAGFTPLDPNAVYTSGDSQ